MMRLSARVTASASMTSPGGEHGVTATWAKAARAARKVGPGKGVNSMVQPAEYCR